MFRLGEYPYQLDVDLGRYLYVLVADPTWIQRRVEHIEFLDDGLCRRNVTVDLDLARVLEEAKEWFPEGSEDPLKKAGHWPVPVAFVRKDLMLDFSIRDIAGLAVTLPTRDEDSFAAASMLAAVAGALIEGDLPPVVAQHLYQIAHAFPEETEPALLDDGTEPSVWATPSGWTGKPRDVWHGLLEWEMFRKLLMLVTYSFPLLVRATEPTTSLVKYSHLAPVEVAQPIWSRLGLAPLEAWFEARIGWERSAHLRIAAPEELQLLSAELEPLPIAKRQDEGKPLVAHRKLRPNMAHINVGGAAHSLYRVRVALRVPNGGFLKTALLAAALTVVNLIALVAHQGTIRRGGLETAATLLLAGPGVLSAYLVRTREHALVNRMLRWVRYAVAFSGMLPYVAAGTLLLTATTPRIAGFSLLFWLTLPAILHVEYMLLVLAFGVRDTWLATYSQRAQAISVRSLVAPGGPGPA